jgi:hypothetical protein
MAAMVVNDLLDDGEAEAGALFAHGHVWLKQTVHGFHRAVRGRCR